MRLTSCCAPWARHVELLDDLEVVLEEGVRLVHAVDLLVDVFRRVVVSPPLRVQLLDAHGAG